MRGHHNKKPAPNTKFYCFNCCRFANTAYEFDLLYVRCCSLCTHDFIHFHLSVAMQKSTKSKNEHIVIHWKRNGSIINVNIMVSVQARWGCSCVLTSHIVRVKEIQTHCFGQEERNDKKWRTETRTHTHSAQHTKTHAYNPTQGIHSTSTVCCDSFFRFPLFLWQIIDQQNYIEFMQLNCYYRIVLGTNNN